MDEVIVHVQVGSLFNVVALLQSALIIFHFSISTYYGIKMIIVKKENRYGWCPEMVVTFESFLWVILFMYISTSTITGNPLINNASFGAVVVRPMILLTSVITAILQRRRYRRALVKFKMEDFLKEKSEQED